MMIKREGYLEEIRSVMGKPVIKVLMGMRRVGKSTLLAQIQEELLGKGINPDQIININFDNPQFYELKHYKALSRYIESKMVPDKKYYMFLDEILEVDGFERVVNSLNAKGQAEVFITGSNSNLLSGELATYLTGRFYTIEILPFSFRELVHTEKTLDEQLWDYIKMGGMPGIFKRDCDEQLTAKTHLMDVYHTVLLREIVNRYNIRDVSLLQRFMYYMMDNVSQVFSAGTVTRHLQSEGRKLSRETIYKYFQAAKAAYLIYGVPRYDIKKKVLLKTNEKFFINDVGFRNLHFDSEKDVEQVLKNIVYLELRRRGYDIYVGKLADREVDFVVINNGTISYIQVAYLLADESTLERAFSVMEAIDDNYAKVVVSMDRVNRSRNGIAHQNIIDFLMDR